ncbi:MAG: SRPBCC domain-containing protein [Acidimicrobiia bacterium]
MPPITIQKDPANRAMTVTVELAAPVERAWQLWADPRQLERWWGPPSHPATVVDHDLRADGRVTYFMTSPEGEKYHGAWRVLSVEAPHHLEVEDVFTDDAGNPVPDLPVSMMVVELREVAAGTTMHMHSTWPTLEAMEQVLAMGMEEGLTGALSQIDAILAAG